MVSTVNRTHELVTENLGLAHGAARRYFTHNPDSDEDLVQVACIGLLKAAHRFRPERGCDFAAYAVPTMSGEIKRYLRDHGWFVRPPRAVQDLNRTIAHTLPDLTQRLGHIPGTAELAEELGESISAVREAAGCEDHLRPASLDAPFGTGATMTLADTVRDDGPSAAVDVSMMLWSALRRLDRQARDILYLRFFADLSQQAIADRVGVSQMQVSRILRRTLAQLRATLAAGDAPTVPEQRSA